MRRTPLIVLVAFILAVDQYTKHLARLLRWTTRSLGPLTLMYTENRGAFLSLGEQLPPHIRAWLLDGVVAIGLIALGIYLIRKPDLPLSLVFAGGAGNLIDRLRFGGRVTDFLYLHAGPLHTGVFNVADMSITAGAVWMLLTWSLQREQSAR